MPWGRPPPPRSATADCSNPITETSAHLNLIVPGPFTWSGGVYLPGPGGVYLVRGCTCLVPGGYYVVTGEGYLPGPGVCLVRGGVPGQVPPRTEFLTHASEIITLPDTSFAGGKNSSGRPLRPYSSPCKF